MGAERFDALVRALPDRLSRRGLLRTGAGGIVAATVTLAPRFFEAREAAAKKKGKKGKDKDKDKRLCPKGASTCPDRFCCPPETPICCDVATTGGGCCPTSFPIYGTDACYRIVG